MKYQTRILFSFVFILYFSHVKSQVDTVSFSNLKRKSDLYYFNDSIYSGYVKGNETNNCFKGKVLNGKKNGLWYYYSFSHEIEKTIDFGESHCYVKEYGTNQKLESTYVLEYINYFPEAMISLFGIGGNGLYFYYDKTGKLKAFKYITNNSQDFFIYDGKSSFNILP